MGCKDGTGCGAKGETCGERKQEAGNRKQEEGSDLRPLTGWDVAAEFVGRAFEEIAERRIAWQAEVDRANKVKQQLVDHVEAFAMVALPMFIAKMSGAGVAATPVPSADEDFRPNPIADFCIEWAKLPNDTRVILGRTLSNLVHIEARIALEELFKYLDKHNVGDTSGAPAPTTGDAS